MITITNLDTVFSKTAMKVGDQNVLLYQLFHGDPAKGIPSYVDFMLKREKGFSELFVSLEQQIVTDS